MNDIDTSELTWDDWDELQRPAPETTDFDTVVAAAVSRRGFLCGLVAIGSGAAAMGLFPGSPAHAQNASPLGFSPIAAQTDGTVHVPEGYSWQIVIRWGDPLFSDAAQHDAATGGTADNALRVFGENTDGMELFKVGSRQIVVVNHEYVNPKINLPLATAGKAQTKEDVLKLQNLQGVTIMEVYQREDGWAVVLDSPFNRRITQNTPMRIAGPAAGHALLQTPADPTGTVVLGTMNNCGAGRTPWGTYLTCEENFNGYFGSTDAELALTDGYKRYGIGLEGRYGYETFDPRFDLAKNPNEPNRFGYIVEIDPADLDGTPVKRTAMGRLKHENAAVVLAADGRPVVYLGDDERGEFLYKFVGANAYQTGEDTSALLDEGQLYAAKFDEDGSGEWLALTAEATGMDDAMIAIHTRQAASIVGATTMDRPEWVAVNPFAVEAYCALTNNKNRAVKPNAGGDQTPAAGPNPRAENRYGQIVRWYPDADDHASTTFGWDLYVMAGNPTVHEDAYAGSDSINEGNLFNSPDGMMFDSKGLLWIQTDGDDDNEGDFAGMGNNQMLVGDPVTGEIQRFMTGPNGCEVTGLTFSLDRRTIFVGIQHPGGSFPDGTGSPRSSIIAITKDDGAIIG